MSQAGKALKKIATGEEYKALVGAIEATDYESIFKSYIQLSSLLEENKNQILERIRNLPRYNKDEDCQKFQAAFSLRTSTTLPQWHWLNSKLKEQGVMEGEVFGFGTKGDPLVRTPEGRIVVIRGTTLEKGARIRFKVVAEGEKLDFGRVLELTPHYFYFLLNQDTQASIRSSFDFVGERLKNRSGEWNENGLPELGELLKKLEDAKELTNRLETVERERAVARIVTYRKRLLSDCGVKLAFELLSREEEREIVAACQGDEQQIARALSAPGLFRRQAHQALKAELFAGDELRGYPGMVNNLENRLDSMNTALELMEFKSGIERVYPSARRYLERMDRLFERLHRRASRVALTLAEDRTCHAEDIHSSIRDAFSGASLGSELRKVFRSAGEFYALRGALIELRAMLGDNSSLPAESALKPYLSQKVASAFGDRS